MHSMKGLLTHRRPNVAGFPFMVALAALFLAVSCAGAPDNRVDSSGKAGAANGAPPAAAAEPAWVSNPRKVYPDAQFVSAVGYGKDRDSAEKNALGALVSVFGQQVTGETVTSSRYSEAVMAGKVTVSEDASVNQAIQTSYDFDTLVGAEIKDTWDDQKGTAYAVAVLDKAKGALLYNDLIESNERTIPKLVDIDSGERDDFASPRSSAIRIRGSSTCCP